jgi:hypothetical protein
MVASHFHLPQKKVKSPRRSGSSEWKTNLILVLLLVQTGLLVWWWIGQRPSSPKILKPVVQETVTTQESEPYISEEPDQLPETTNQAQPQRSFVQDPIRIQVLNGCGVRGIARRIADCLRSKGFDVRETGNADRYDYAQTRVIGRVEDTLLPRLVGDSIGAKDVSTNPNQALVDIEVTVIIGKDHAELRCR